MICCAEIATVAKTERCMANQASEEKDYKKTDEQQTGRFFRVSFKFQTLRVLCVYPHYIYGALYPF
jgi:hypothetical protein